MERWQAGQLVARRCLATCSRMVVAQRVSWSCSFVRSRHPLGKDGRISWRARDTTVVNGHLGHDTTGTIQGEEISLRYSGIGFTDGSRYQVSSRDAWILDR